MSKLSPGILKNLVYRGSRCSDILTMSFLATLTLRCSTRLLMEHKGLSFCKFQCLLMTKIIQCSVPFIFTFKCYLSLGFSDGSNNFDALVFSLKLKKSFCLLVIWGTKKKKSKIHFQHLRLEFKIHYSEKPKTL